MFLSGLSRFHPYVLLTDLTSSREVTNKKVIKRILDQNRKPRTSKRSNAATVVRAGDTQVKIKEERGLLHRFIVISRNVQGLI